MAMTHLQALEVLAAHRGGRIVITTMGSVGLWPQLSDGPLHGCLDGLGHEPSPALRIADDAFVAL